MSYFGWDETDNLFTVCTVAKNGRATILQLKDLTSEQAGLLRIIVQQANLMHTIASEQLTSE